MYGAYRGAQYTQGIKWEFDIMINLETIRCVSFDAWNTLVVGDPRFRDVRVSLFAQAIGDVSLQALAVAAKQIDDEYDRYTEQTGEDFDFTARVKGIIERLGMDPRAYDAVFYAALQQKVNATFIEKLPSFIEKNLEETFSSLQQKELKLALLSNTGFIDGKTMRMALDRLGVLRFFDITLFSNEVAVAKPHRKIYDMFVARSGFNPGQILHIGDNIHADYEGAVQSGLRALLYDPKGVHVGDAETIKSLEELL